MALTDKEYRFNERLEEIASQALEEFDINDLLELKKDAEAHYNHRVDKAVDLKQFIANLDEAIKRLSPMLLAFQKLKKHLIGEWSNCLDNSYM